MSGSIIISDLQIHVPNGLGPSAFGLTPPPPCLISLTLEMILEDGIISTDEDTMSGLGVNYSSVSKQIYANLSNPERTWKSPMEALSFAARLSLQNPAVKSTEVTLEISRALLHARSVTYSSSIAGEGVSSRRLKINGLQVSCVIGLHPHEQMERQRLEVDVFFPFSPDDLELKNIADNILSFVENSSFGTLESLAEALSAHILSTTENPSVPQEVHLTIRKPSALPFGVPSVKVVRRRELESTPTATLPAPNAPPPPSTPATAGPSRRTFIALGSNMGDRLSHFNRSISLLQSHGITLIHTGRLYESEPMYVEDQERFMNTAIEVRAPEDMDAMGVLRVLKRVEREVGRTKTFRNGPRVVDLDLIYFGDEVVRVGKKGDAEDEDGVGWLEVPHWGLGEREFVLRPLADIDPDFFDPRLRIPIKTLLSRLPSTVPPQLAPLLPFPHPTTPMRTQQSTPRIMAIINATPDSFSDGAETNLSIPHVLASLRTMFAVPFPPHILDIGGMSTRPNSIPCTEAEELDRVVPLIRAIRALSDVDPILRSIPISIDTYRPAVARAAIEAGASCINDVRGGREEGMLATMAELDVPVVLMHSRGDSTSMTTAALQDYSSLGGVVLGVRKELKETVDKAEKAGVKRWNIILDPGLGFAKSGADNLVLIKRAKELTGPGSGLEGYPVLIGGSRKGFVGKVISREIAFERGMGDAGVLAYCTDVDIVRVHDSRAAGEVLEMMAAIRDAK